MSPQDVNPAAGSAGRPTRPLPTDALIVVPVRNTVLFPEIVFPITLGRASTIAAAQQAVREQRQIVIVLQREAEKDDPGPDDLYRIGTVANIVRYVTSPEGGHHLICQGVQRFRITDFVEGYPFLLARGLHLAEPTSTAPEVEARFNVLQEQVREVLDLLPRVPPELRQTVEATSAPGMLADLAITYLDATPAEKQDILETTDLVPRLDKVSKLLAHRLEVLRLSAEIGNKTKASLDTRQREVLLREQMAAIQRELGDEGSNKQDLADLEKAIAEARMPTEVEAAAKKELRRLQRTPEAAAEYGMIRSYLDTLLELPWAPPEPKDIDIAEARRILDADHYGLEKIKQRIIEYLAVRKLAPEGKAPILCFVGPPGVGKTSLGQSIARAMGRKFARVSLGGVHNEAEIRGHRRTYIGALPGNIIQAIRKAGARDSRDDAGRDRQDGHRHPRRSGRRHARGTRPRAELDVPRQLSRCAVRSEPRRVHHHGQHAGDRARPVARSHGDHRTHGLHRGREARDRQALPGASPARSQRAQGRAGRDRRTRPCGASSRATRARRACATWSARLAGVLRHVAVRSRKARPTRSTSASRSWRRPWARCASRTKSPCARACRAWRPGSPGRRSAATSCSSRRRACRAAAEFLLTGQLGEVMRESAQAALSLVKSMAAKLGIDPALFEKSDIHVHVPAGATPKDGPSAGVAMFMALALAADRPAPSASDTAMTGEISLRGLVLPVGGIKEKVVAAAAAGITPRDAAGPQQARLRRHPGRSATGTEAGLARPGRRCSLGGAAIDLRWERAIPVAHLLIRSADLQVRIMLMSGPGGPRSV